MDKKLQNSRTICTRGSAKCLRWGGRGVSVSGVTGLVNEASCRWEETVLAEVLVLDGPQPPARGESLQKFVSKMKEADNNLTCTPQGPWGVQVLERRQIAAAHLLSRANDTLQSASVPDRDLSTKTETTEITETETQHFSIIICPLWILFLLVTGHTNTAQRTLNSHSSSHL